LASDSVLVLSGALAIGVILSSDPGLSGQPMGVLFGDILAIDATDLI